jgi:hypothetical protein
MLWTIIIVNDARQRGIRHGKTESATTRGKDVTLRSPDTLSSHKTCAREKEED